MIRNYFKIAIRSIWKNKIHSLINIFGLALGTAVVLLIGVFVVEELNVNSEIKDLKRTYVIHSRWSPENLGVFYTTLGPLGFTLKEQYPTLIEDSYRYTIASSTVSSSKDKTFREQLQIGDASFITMFGFELLHGDIRSAFVNNGIVITHSKAKKYFGRVDVLGEILTLKTNSGDQVDFQVTGILKDIPTYNTVVNFAGNPTPNELFISTEGFKHFMEGADKEWWFKYMVTIVKLTDGTTPADLEVPLERIVSLNAPPEFKDNLVCELRPLESYYLQWGNSKVLKLVGTLAALAFFTLLLTVFNFISIMISSSSYRLKEIGLRKLFGGIRKYLILQFLMESIITSLIALVLAGILYILLHPVFQDLLEKPLTPIYEIDFFVLFGVLLFSVIIGILAGLYPALRLSRLKIVDAVKGKLPAFGEGKFTRKFLLGFQIVVTSFVLISSVVISQQLKYIQRYDLGFDNRRVLVISSVPREWNEKGVSKIEAVRKDLLVDNKIVAGSISYEVPDGNAGNQYNFRSSDDSNVDMPLLKVDENFANTYGIGLLAGRFFHHKNGTHQPHRIVLNEAAASSFGWSPESAIGKTVRTGEDAIPMTVVGVVENFHFKSLFESIAPIAMRHIRDGLTYRYLSLKLAATDEKRTIESLRSKWMELFPKAPFDYAFMEDKVNRFYQAENRVYKSSKIVSLILVIITALGIIAFMSFSLVELLQEIAIRKVHGAKLTDLIILLLKCFVWEFVIGGLLAGSIAFYFLTNWLNNFVYRIDIPVHLFLFVHLMLLIFLSLLIVAYSFRTIKINPIKILRFE